MRVALLRHDHLAELSGHMSRYGAPNNFPIEISQIQEISDEDLDEAIPPNQILHFVHVTNIAHPNIIVNLCFRVGLSSKPHTYVILRRCRVLDSAKREICLLDSNISSV